MMTKKLFLFVAPMSAMLLFGEGDAQARDRSYPGINCTEQFDSSPNRYVIGVSAYNDESSARSFVCPVPWFDDKTHIRSAAILYYDGDHQSGVSCELRTCSHLGTFCGGARPQASGSSYKGSGVLGFGLLADAHAHAVAYFRCSIPKRRGTSSRSGIHSYRVSD